MNLQVTDIEYKVIIQALRYYEDNTWFSNKNIVKPLIEKLNTNVEINKNEDWILCDY